jgi:phage/conjugal plasmid C-4 type zinc finger TraR family protein
MAGGWTRDGAVQEQIDASIADELKRMQVLQALTGAGRTAALTHCAECEEPIPEARRRAVPGATLCVECQRARDARPVPRGGINRRGSKDSQLR